MKIVGSDIGGTFTDLVFLDEKSRKLRVGKVFSTPSNQSVGLINGLEEIGADIPDLGILIHGTTVATNAILERKGAVCGLITTKGFRDVLELRRRDRPFTYGLTGTFEPLISREFRLETDERTNAQGSVLKEVSEAEVEALARTLLKSGVQGVVVSFLHSYLNPHNERKALAALKRVWPNDYIVLSSEILPEFREFERTSTAAANAYVQPVISRYLASLSQALTEKGYRGTLLVIQSNGGMMSVEAAQKFTVNTFLSGPAAGVTAATHIAEAAGFDRVISCDMGGTSCDVSLIDQGKPIYTTEQRIDFGIPVKVPMIDIKTIGAGGGSIARIDRSGLLRVGPESAGADPGPVCYGRGGKEPTITDANLILGRIGSPLLVGAKTVLNLDLEATKECLKRTIGKPLGLDLFQAAHAIIEIANHKMAGTIRQVSIERGYDPREFVLVPFGGAGPMHACALMKEVGIGKAVVPFHPGVISALGCLLANFRHDLVQTINQPLEELDMGEVHKVFSSQVERGRAIISQSGVGFERIDTIFEADMSYEGQTHVLRVPLPSSHLTRNDAAKAFFLAYKKKFFDLLEAVPIRMVNLRSTVLGLRPKVDLKGLGPEKAGGFEAAIKGKRPVYFGGQFVSCPIVERSRLATGISFTGPAIIEQRDTTTVIEPGTKVLVDDYYNLVMELA